MTKTAKAPQRAKLAHKLAKYYRAAPIHLQDSLSANKPSHEHLVFGGAPKPRITNKANSWYPADDDKVHYKRNRTSPKVTAGRKSIEEGSIVVLLAGHHRGRRVVVLKKLNNNQLLVTGPYKVNGVPLKLVNAAYVIATSTKVSLAGVNTDLPDNFFKKPAHFSRHELKDASKTVLKKKEDADAAVLAKKEQAAKIQKSVDTKLIENIKAVEQLRGYLETRFALYNNVRFHELKF